MRGIVRGEAERARLLAAYGASAMSAKSFAEREGIAPSTLYQWLAGAEQTQTAPRIARVIRRRAKGKRTQTKPEGAALVLEMGVARVHVAAGFDPSALAALLDLLETRARASRS
jgi:transposase-like protein